MPNDDRIENMRVHPKNRGGAYLAGVAAKRLLERVLPEGFDKHVFGHQVVAVEVPLGDSAALEYNDNECKQDGLLLSRFGSPHNEVRYKLLS